jgi:hypothetical protein
MNAAFQENDPYQGIALAMPPKGVRGLTALTAGWARQRLKPAVNGVTGGMPEGIP